MNQNINNIIYTTVTAHIKGATSCIFNIAIATPPTEDY